MCNFTEYVDVLQSICEVFVIIAKIKNEENISVNNSLGMPVQTDLKSQYFLIISKIVSLRMLVNEDITSNGTRT